MNTTNKKIRLHERTNGPAVVSIADIRAILTYSDAIRFGWENRQIKNMTRATLAELTGIRPSHLSDYLNPCRVDKHGRELREMPAKYIPAFEQAVGNTFASQWLAMQSQLTILEAMMPGQE